MQVFDSHAGELPEDLFNQFVLPSLTEIVNTVKERLGGRAVPMVNVFCNVFYHTSHRICSSTWDVEIVVYFATK